MRGERTFEDQPGKLGPLAPALDLASDAVRRVPAVRHRAGLDALPVPPTPERFLPRG